ncbi:MAG: PD-(D/E)XK nuclease family protein [Holosporaceae bacterium]|jgi:ATP-dependent helicase/nuclease subunit B|nr:PD-(D/E)XK nuclease family protein [Holosporaceae bacterium]
MGQVYRISSGGDFLKEVAEILLSQRDLERYTVCLPNGRSCRILKNYLLNNEAIFLPKLVNISSFLSFDEMILPLVEFLKTEKQGISFGTLYELAESLSLLIKELILNKIEPEQLSMIIPENLQKYWNHTIAIIDAAMRAPKIKKNINLIREKLDVFLKSIKPEKLVAVDIEAGNYYAKLLMKNAYEHGIAVFDDMNFAELPNTIEYTEFNSIFDEGLGVALAIRKAVFEQKSVLVVSPDPDLTEIIKSELRRWNILADDSKGVPFSKTKDGLLVSLAIDVIEKGYDCVSVISFIKMNPLFLSITLKLELFFRQQKSVPPNFFTAFSLYQTEDKDLLTLVGKIAIIANDANEMKLLSEWLDVCCQLISLINRESVEKLREIVPQSFSDLSVKITLQEFCIFFRNYIGALPVRAVVSYTPNVVILGIIEAHLLNADQIIIASVNEESWFKSSEKNDFWMTQSMLRHFGIQSNEMKNEFRRKIFKELIHKKNVLVTRSILAGNVKRQKYRYLDKITENLNVIDAAWLQKTLLDVQKIHRSEKIKFSDPNPRLQLRPRNFWASDLDLLIDNPYVFYAKRILKLPEIGHINELKNIRGNYMHEVLEEFVKSSGNKKDVEELWRSAQKIFKTKWLTPFDLGVWFFQLDEIFSFIVRHMGDKNSYAEIRGDCSLKISADCEVTINCWADRIDMDENISIIDYKTGNCPTPKQVKDGKKIQLPVESIIAENDGFGLNKTTVGSLCFWKLGASMENNKIVFGGRVVKIANNQDEVRQLHEKILGVLRDLIHRYNVLGEAYKVNVRSSYNKPYMHLARVKEWTK